MTELEIRALKLKPDLQRAMIYVAQQASQKISAQQAEALADLMQQATTPRLNLLQIWVYQGGTDFVRQTLSTSIDVSVGVYFGVRDQKAFVNNCWCPLSLNPDLLINSVYVEDGDPTRLNLLNKQRKNKEYGV